MQDTVNEITHEAVSGSQTSQAWPSEEKKGGACLPPHELAALWPTFTRTHKAQFVAREGYRAQFVRATPFARTHQRDPFPPPRAHPRLSLPEFISHVSGLFC